MRAKAILEVCQSLGIPADVREVVGCGLPSCASDCQVRALGNLEFSHLIVDSYRVKESCLQAIRKAREVKTLQLVDYVGQPIWADYKLDPFNVLPKWPNTFSGLEFAVTGVTETTQTSIADNISARKGLLVATGSSATEIHYEISSIACNWPHITVVTPIKRPNFLPGNVAWVSRVNQEVLFELFQTSQVSVTNCGVTGLQRLVLGSPGYSTQSADNQRSAAVCLGDAGANVTHHSRDVVSKIQAPHTPPLESPALRKIGAKLGEVLRIFLEGVPQS